MRLKTKSELVCFCQWLERRLQTCKHIYLSSGNMHRRDKILLLRSVRHSGKDNLLQGFVHVWEPVYLFFMRDLSVCYMYAISTPLAYICLQRTWTIFFTQGYKTFVSFKTTWEAPHYATHTHARTLSLSPILLPIGGDPDHTALLATTFSTCRIQIIFAILLYWGFPRTHLCISCWGLRHITANADMLYGAPQGTLSLHKQYIHLYKPLTSEVRGLIHVHVFVTYFPDIGKCYQAESKSCKNFAGLVYIDSLSVQVCVRFSSKCSLF